VSIGLYCALLAPQWKANLRSTSVQVMNTWPLGYSITGLKSQNRKFAAILVITGPKNDHFCVCKQTGFVDQRLWDFAKITLTRVESSHSVKSVNRLESSHHLSQRDSNRVRVTKNRESSRVESLTQVTLSLVLEHSYFYPRFSFLCFWFQKVRQISHFLWCCALVNIFIRK